MYYCCQLLSCVWVFETSRAAAHQASLSFTISWNFLKLMSTKIQWSHPTISFSVSPFFSCPQPFSVSGSFLSWLFKSGGQSIGALALASVLPMNIQGWFPLGLAVQETLKNPPVPQFERINFLVLSLLYAPTIISIHDYWKKHSFDYTDLCWQSNVSAF